MFRLELDVSLYFIPPMDEHGGGIMLTRTLELPFAPTPGLIVYGKSLEECPEPVGFKLDDLIWDMDREVFLASSRMINAGLPIALIPEELRSWVDRGWRLGSYKDVYAQPGEPEDEPGEPSVDGDEDEWEMMERWPTMGLRARPREFNKTLRALVREMATVLNNENIAYAIDKTKRFFDEAELKGNSSPAAKRYHDALTEYFEMPSEERLDWRDHVMKKYPRLDRIVAAL